MWEKWTFIAAPSPTTLMRISSRPEAPSLHLVCTPRRSPSEGFGGFELRKHIVERSLGIPAGDGLPLSTASMLKDIERDHRT
jgi:hypothetical protein